MGRVTYSMGVSLDGYIAGPDGSFDFSPPDETLFRFITEQTRGLAAYVMGRRLYETMLYWETAEDNPALDFDTRDWASVWRELPKLVFSRTLSGVEGNARLATGGLGEELDRLREAAGHRDIAIGGATIAAEAARLGQLDEYEPRVSPVLVGGGTPFWPRVDGRIDLELVDSRVFSSRTVVSRYRVARPSRPDFA